MHCFRYLVSDIKFITKLFRPIKITSESQCSSLEAIGKSFHMVSISEFVVYACDVRLIWHIRCPAIKLCRRPALDLCLPPPPHTHAHINLFKQILEIARILWVIIWVVSQISQWHAPERSLGLEKARGPGVLALYLTFCQMTPKQVNNCCPCSWDDILKVVYFFKFCKLLRK